MKKCIDCSLLLPISDFYRSYIYKGKITYKGECKKCNQIRSNKWANANKYKRYGYEIKHRYGITIQEYENLLKKQKNKCIICYEDQKTFKRKLHVDHCHKTNKVRGLLCYSCNSAIGLFKDNIKSMKRAIKYVKNSGD